MINSAHRWSDMNSVPSEGFLSKLFHTGIIAEFKLDSCVDSSLSINLGSVASANHTDHQPSGLNGNHWAKPVTPGYANQCSGGWLWRWTALVFNNNLFSFFYSFGAAEDLVLLFINRLILHLRLPRRGFVIKKLNIFSERMFASLLLQAETGFCVSKVSPNTAAWGQAVGLWTHQVTLASFWSWKSHACYQLTHYFLKCWLFCREQFGGRGCTYLLVFFPWWRLAFIKHQLFALMFTVVEGVNCRFWFCVGTRIGWNQS